MENFREPENSHTVMQLLKKLEIHSETMQLVILKNLDGMSWEELVDFILRFLMRSWISFASARVGNHEFFEFICLKKFL